MNNLEEELKDLEDQLSREKNTVSRAVLSDKIRLKKQEIKEAAEEVKEPVVVTKKDDPVDLFSTGFIFCLILRSDIIINDNNGKCFIKINILSSLCFKIKSSIFHKHLIIYRYIRNYLTSC